MEVEEWLNNNKLAIDVFNKKYRHNNESLDQWFERVSNGDEALKNLIISKRFLFAGRVLANRGLQKEGKRIVYNNCFVLPNPRDNIEDVFDTAKYAARIYSTGGGVGFDISGLRPNGARVNNAAEFSSGPLSFMDLYNLTTDIISQSGRRGALLLSMRCDHPDIEQFITIKSDLNKLNKANISVKMTDEFMQAVLDNKPFKLSFTTDIGEVIEKTVNAKELFDKFVKNNYNYAEPGIMFIDEVEGYNLLSEDPNYEIANSNPCGEAYLPAFGACNLGSFNLVEYLELNKYYEWEFNFNRFMRDIPIVVNAMNDILDESVNLLPLKEQQETVAKWRQLGIGFFGFANTLMYMKIKYGSQESIDFAKEITSTLINQSVLASSELAARHGTYPAYNYDCVSSSAFYQEILKPFVKRSIEKYGLRNSQFLSIAPNGSIALLCNGLSGGIEPVFAISYTRKTESLYGTAIEYKVYDPTVQDLINEGTIKDVNNLPDYVVASSQVKPHDRVLMQATFQKYIDSAISSTVNLPNSATEEDVKNVYIDAWKNCLKGITVYRSGCAREGILSTETKENVLPSNNNVQAGNSDTLKRGDWKQLAEDTVYYERRVYTGCASFALFIGWSQSEQKLQDVWVKQKGKGGCSKSIDAMVIELSAILRLGGSLNNIEKAFTGLETCNSFIRARDKGQKLTSGSSCADCILKTVKNFEKEMTCSQEPITKEPEKTVITDISEEEKLLNEFDKIVEKHFFKTQQFSTCPECGEELTHEGGCITCKTCGYSKCS